jgi:hypothetical protein
MGQQAELIGRRVEGSTRVEIDMVTEREGLRSQSASQLPGLGVPMDTDITEGAPQQALQGPLHRLSQGFAGVVRQVLVQCVHLRRFLIQAFVDRRNLIHPTPPFLMVQGQNLLPRPVKVKRDVGYLLEKLVEGVA